MTGNEFIRRVRALARTRGVPVQLDAKRGKGSHQVLFLGKTRTTVRNPKDQLKTGMLHAMCTQLGIRVTDL